MRVLDCVTWLAISDLALQMAIVEFVMFCLVFGLVVQYIEYIETWLRTCSNPELCNVISDHYVTFWIKSLEVNREFD